MQFATGNTKYDCKVETLIPVQFLGADIKKTHHCETNIFFAPLRIKKINK